MSQLVALAFEANAKSTVVMNRSLTQAEVSAILLIKQNAITAGGQVSPNITTTDAETGNFISVAYFDTIATANTIVSAYLAFDPAPISAVAVAV
jgi:hypothetical protein